MSKKSDIVIIGGGPSGLHAARLLSSSGVSVCLLEEHKQLGFPVHCTGVLAAEAFDEFDLPRSAILNELHTLRVYSPSGNSVAYTTPRTEALVVDRGVFDSWLSESAQRTGVNILSGTRAINIRIREMGVVVETAAGVQIEALGCILASGANYGLQLRLGLGFPELYLKSAQIEVPSKKPRDVEIHLGSLVAPRGFAWAVPVHRKEGIFCKIGLMCDGDAETCFRLFFERLANAWGLSDSDVRPRIKILPLAPIPQTVRDRILVIGDAAGRVKPTTGGGIYYSLVSAELAAGVFSRAIKTGDFSSRFLQEYETLWQNKVSAEVEAQLTLRAAISKLTDNAMDELVELARTDGILPLVRKTAKFNEHRHFISALLGHQDARKILFGKIRATFT